MVDSAFKVANAPYLIKTQNEEPMEPELNTVNSNVTSIRQLSEWGMRIIKVTLHIMEELPY